MPKLDKDAYSKEEVEKFLQEEGDKARLATEKRYSKDYVSKDDHNKLVEEYTTFKTATKSKEFGELFNKESTELKLISKYADDVKTLAKITIDDTPEIVKAKLTAFKVDKPIFFEHKPIDVGTTSQPKPKQEENPAFIPGTLTRKR